MRNLREKEDAHIKNGHVNKKHPYASNEAVYILRERRKQNKKLLENSIAENDQGERFTLQELAETSMANPENRRSELMTVANGLERYAEQYKHNALFITVTAPSKYHKVSRKYAGFTPKQTNQYLQKQWAKVRAFLKRHGAEYYGLRVSEPHKDGTPHAHYLIFCDKQDDDIVRTAFIEYALEHDSDEVGASFNRIKVERLPAGTATAYLAKYVSKNIDGFGIQSGEQMSLDGMQPIDHAERVKAWASPWGIRQFQRIGKHPIGIWRELRRLSTELQANSKFAKYKWLLWAVDNADYFAYLIEMDKLGNEISITRDLEEWKENRFGERVQGVIRGVQLGLEFVETRFREWILKINEIKNEADEALKGFFKNPWTCVNNCTQLFRHNREQSENYHQMEAVA